jgi:hypothetical protein
VSLHMAAGGVRRWVNNFDSAALRNAAAFRKSLSALATHRSAARRFAVSFMLLDEVVLSNFSSG